MREEKIKKKTSEIEAGLKANGAGRKMPDTNPPTMGGAKWRVAR